MGSAQTGPWRLLLACLLGLVIGLLAYVFFLTEAWAYFSDDPYACANCHRMEQPLSSWLASTHHASAGCNDCHAPRGMAARGIRQAANGIRHSWSFTFGTGGATLRLRAKNALVLEENCIRCHAALLPTLLQGETVSGGRCTRCHSATGHA